MIRWRRRCRSCGRLVWFGRWGGVWRDAHARRSDDWLEHWACYDVYERKRTGATLGRVDHETPAPLPFGLMLRRAGDIADPDADWPDPQEHEGIYLAPDFTTRHLRHDTGAGGDPRYGEDVAQQWSLSLPHRCGEWGIWDGPREDVLEAARRFRAELDQAITALEAAA